MSRIAFEILGEPQAQKRHRTGRGFNYDPSADAKQDFLLAVQHNAPEKPVSGAISMRIEFYFSRPKSHFGTGKNKSTLKTSAPLFHTKKPDGDNLIKFVLDAMSKIFFIDDAQIFAIAGTKRYSDRPRISVEMWWGGSNEHCIDS